MSSRSFDTFEFTDSTEIVVSEDEITTEQADDLDASGVAKIKSYQTDTGEVNTFMIEVSKLVEIAYEHQVLKEVASTVEVEVLRVLRDNSGSQLTTNQITKRVDRPKSSVSRALTSLAENNRVQRIQNGVYKYVG